MFDGTDDGTDVTATIDRLNAATASLDPPLAALDLATLRTNAEDLVRRAEGTPVRVASKSVRCRAVLEIALGSGLTASGGFRGIMAYSLREAVWLARQGAEDVLMGYPTVDRGALAELGSDSALLGRITLMVERRRAAGPDPRRGRLRRCAAEDLSRRRRLAAARTGAPRGAAVAAA